jgi:cysteine sulfinate desulfinase/cysteine desulfurase-like protein
MRHANSEAAAEQQDGVHADSQNDAAANFITVKLELANIFCELALKCHSHERARQHRLDARRATDAAFHALIKVHMNKEEMESIVTRIEGVKALLESLEAGGSTHPSC